MSYLLLAPGLGTDGPLAAVLGRLARRHRVHAHDPGIGAPTAVLCPPGSRWEQAAGAVPVAWWVDGPAPLPRPHARLRLVVSTAPLGADLDLDVPVEVLATPALDGSDVRPVMPFVRERRRRRTDDDSVDVTGLDVCAAAVVGPGDILRALALGTPAVCDAATPAIVGAVDGVHVVVTAGAEAQQAAAVELGADLLRATRLARAGRRLIEGGHDVAAAARRIATALDLAPVGVVPIARLATALEELGTPRDALVSRRAAGWATSLGPSGAAAAAGALRW